MNNPNSVTIEDYLISNPFSKKGRDALNRIHECFPDVSLTFEDFFAKKIYTEPFFITNNSDTETFEFECKPNARKMQILREKKANFEKSLFSKSSKPLFLIRASSGAGKSIYLNYLKFIRRKSIDNTWIDSKNFVNGRLNDVNEINFDLEYSASTLEKGKVKFPSSEYPLPDKENNITATWQFYIMILEATYEIVQSIIYSDDTKRIKNFRTNFDIIYQENYVDEIESILTLMTNPPPSKREKATKLIEILIRYGNIDKGNPYECIKNILKLLTRFVLCDSDLNNPKQILISFDNIEHYIEIDKRIYDSDIELISDAVTKFIQDEEIYYESLNLKFPSFFKVVMVIRDTTNNMLAKKARLQRYFSQYVQDSINITNWYPTAEIYDAKLSYFSQYINHNSTPIKFFKLIINDNKNTRGSSCMGLLSAMYNHNKRRLTRILSDISNLFDNTSSIYACKSINYQQFENIFTTSIEHSENNYMDVRFLCRQALLRLVFNEIYNTGFFNRIYGNENFPSSTRTYARRILTYIANNKNYDTEEYVSFYEIVNALLVNPDVSEGEIDQNELNNIADILIALNEYEFSDAGGGTCFHDTSGSNKWCQLIILKFNDQSCTNPLDATSLANKLFEMYTAKDESTENFGIRITEAGWFFVNSLCNFEYFACRCNKYYMPLLFMKDEDMIKESIEEVFNMAEKCIKSTLIQEYAFFHGSFGKEKTYNYNLRIKTQSGKNSNYPFPIRLIIQHISYLYSYRNYLTKDTLHDSFELISKDVRNNLIETVDEFINRYKNIAKKLLNSEYLINYRGKKTLIKNYVPEKVKKSIKYYV